MNTPQNKSAQNSEQNPNHAINPTSLVGLNRERGLAPLPLEPELLLQRIAQKGHSGHFLADAFISAYRTHKPFLHSLGELSALDAEGFRLFHQILHIRHVPGWSDDSLYQIEQRIIALVGGAK